ncbi:MAG: hypothetical protein KDD35_07300 [Bdellovibrionales bacterium]|nr:hypothetical protein [Bdellovibrionales bacterium]
MIFLATFAPTSYKSFVRFDYDGNSFRIKRLRLTKLWLFALLFNVILQFDAVEDLFLRPQSPSPQYVSMKLECSSRSSLGTPRQKEQFFAQFAFLGGMTNRVSQEVAIFEAFGLQNWDCLHLEIFFGRELLPFQKTDLSQMSGLSPPYLT